MRRYIQFNPNAEATLTIYPDWTRQLYLSDDTTTVTLDTHQVQSLLDHLIPGTALDLQPQPHSACELITVRWEGDDLRFAARDGRAIRWKRGARLLVEWLRELEPRRALGQRHRLPTRRLALV
ncbi:MAG TPA: hypothetical protein PLC98_00680 [Anaerolineales bacterium]|nr:hypothetical protein [Anaerolineales bacterium]